MGLPNQERDDPLSPGRIRYEDRARLGELEGGGAAAASWVGDVVDPLKDDPGECWLAMEALATVEPAVRCAIIAELSGHRSTPGVRTLLHLLSASRDPSTREAARLALPEAECASEPAALGWQASAEDGCPPLPTAGGCPPARSGIRLIRSLVTPVDGRGCGSIVVSISQVGQRRTAAFWCDVTQGILDVIGEVEPDSLAAGRLVDDFVHQVGADCSCDRPELALGLLGGSLMLCGPKVPGAVRDWLDGTLGPGFQPSGLPVVIPGLEVSSISDEELPRRAHQVLDACPSWLDSSELTFEMAEEISMREGRLAADSDRDAGAYRFLFEHLLIHRLELYRRMLLWMAWFWQCSGETELARSAFALACQLSDEQYAVPSHPFTVALTTRSLEAAQARLRTAEDPRRCA